MSWFPRRSPATASAEALAAISAAEQQLIRAKMLRAEAEKVGASLHRSRIVNHFGLGLENAMKAKEN